MSEQKHCGVDLNGWSDRVCRNWHLTSDGERVCDDYSTNAPVIGPAVVLATKGETRTWIGGAQAQLAPHGRGSGWGLVGSKDRRRSVRSILEDEHTAEQALAAAISGLASGATYCAISIDDHENSDESFRERLLRAVRRGGVGKGTLVWRPVLAVLGQLETEPTFARSVDRMTVGVVSHHTNGFTVQRLTLRREGKGDSAILAPERKQFAVPISSELGYNGLYCKALTQVATYLSVDNYHSLKSAHTPFCLALTGFHGSELLREDSGNFFEVKPRHAATSCEDDLGDAPFESISDCDVALFESVTTSRRRSEILSIVEARLPIGIVDTSDAVVARGAAVAATRSARRQPVFFDYLPMISTIVLSVNGPETYDLIDKDETLPAGQIYRSPKPAQFVLPSGSEALKFYLKKEPDPTPRRAVISLDHRTEVAEKINLSVEQIPAAGHARLIANSLSTYSQFSVDWNDSEEIVGKAWEDILAEMGTPRPKIPDRVVLPCGLAPWNGPTYYARKGLRKLLAKFCEEDRIQWDVLAERIAAKSSDWSAARAGVGAHRNVYCVSSDGELPQDLESESRRRLDHLSKLALEHVKARASGGTQDDNSSLRFLTWQFRYAPLEVPEILIGALEDWNRIGYHPLVSSPGSLVLLYQGLGRTAQTVNHEERAFKLLFSCPVEDWGSRTQTAAAAFLLSRSETAPSLIDRSQIELLARRVVMDLEEGFRRRYSHINYSGFLLAGMLRLRIRFPFALLSSIDPIAEKLTQALGRCLKDIEEFDRTNVRGFRAVRKVKPLLEDLKDALQHKDLNVNILGAFEDLVTG